VGFLVGWLEDQERNRVRDVIVAWTDGAAHADTLAPLEGFRWIPVGGERATRPALERSILQKEAEAALLLSPRYAFDGEGELILRRLDPSWKRRLEHHLTQAARLERARARGLTPEALAGLDASVELAETSPLPQAHGRDAEKIVAVVVAILLLMTLFVTGAYMGIGITGEKHARVTEVIVSAVPAQAWIDGKIAAYTAVGFLQTSIWAGAAVAFLGVTAWTLPASLDLGFVVLAASYAALGFLFYSGLFALIYATIKDLQSTSKFQAYLYFLPFVPVLVMGPALENPEVAYVVALSLLPPFAPILMPMRAAIGGTALWEILVGLALLVVAVYYVRLAAGHAFRIGMLMYGKELSLPELVRWSREA
jgi:ABC-2 type transport system permease protein